MFKGFEENYQEKEVVQTEAVINSKNKAQGSSFVTAEQAVEENENMEEDSKKESRNNSRLPAKRRKLSKRKDATDKMFEMFKKNS